MRAGWIGQGLGMVVGAAVALTATQGQATAARQKPSAQASRSASAHGFSRVAFHRGGRFWHPSFQRSALQCVPFARENSGIELSGNAGTWWANAAGLYQRGARPEVGSILNFRATGNMRMSHVAVVTNVLSPRHIEIDHANWGAPGRVSRNIDVVDVSPDNDWTSVRVAMGQTEDYGGTYPTFGFIYDRPDGGTLLANDTRAAPLKLNPPPSTQFALDDQPEEVAEAPDDDAPASHYGTRRHGHGHYVARASRQHGVVASTYRVSTAAKPASHKANRHRL